MEALRTAVVGTGFIGRVHARSARLAGARLVGVAGSSPASGQQAAEELGAERAFASGRPAVVNVITDHKARASTVRFSAYTT